MTKRTKPDKPTDERPTEGQKQHERQLRKRKFNGATEQGSQQRYSKSDYRVETGETGKPH
jgi:hypothetical protein